MRSFSPTQKRVLLIPLLLIPSTALVFAASYQLSAPEQAYVVGFLFYWIVWCLLMPLFLLKRSGLVSLLNEENPLFRRSNLLPALVLVLIVLITGIMYPPSQWLTRHPGLLIIAVPVAVVNGFCEEALWRGVYVRAFPRNFALAVLYPSVGFALWHLSPQIIFPAEGGVWPFVASTFFLGICYGWISYRTRSIRWPAISHSLGGILSAGGLIAPSIYTILSQ